MLCSTGFSESSEALTRNGSRQGSGLLPTLPALKERKVEGLFVPLQQLGSGLIPR